MRLRRRVSRRGLAGKAASSTAKGDLVGLGRLLVRSVIGGLFIGHGTQKLFGWFGGGGLDTTGKGFEAIGLAPGRRNALAAGLAESGGGALLALGLATPLAEAMLISVMLTAIRTVHWKNGPWATNGGYEYNVVLIAPCWDWPKLDPGYGRSIVPWASNGSASSGWPGRQPLALRARWRPRRRPSLRASARRSPRSLSLPLASDLGLIDAGSP